MVTAGTSDIPVAEEALVTARTMGNRVEAIYDVGVAGIHRLLEHRDELREARVIVCVAGMEERAAECGRRVGGGPGDCGSDEHGIRRKFRRPECAAGNAE